MDSPAPTATGKMISDLTVLHCGAKCYIGVAQNKDTTSNRVTLIDAMELIIHRRVEPDGRVQENVLPVSVKAWHAESFTSYPAEENRISDKDDEENSNMMEPI